VCSCWVVGGGGGGVVWATITPPWLGPGVAFARGVDNEEGSDEGGGGERAGGKKDVTWRRLNHVTKFGQFPNLDNYPKLLFTNSFGFHSGQFQEWHSCLHSGNMQIPARFRGVFRRNGILNLAGTCAKSDSAGIPGIL